MKTNLLRFKISDLENAGDQITGTFRAVFDTDVIGANLEELKNKAPFITKNPVIDWVGNCLFFDFSAATPRDLMKIKLELNTLLRDYLINLNLIYGDKVIIWTQS